MKKRIISYFKHLSITLLVLAASATFFGLYHGASLQYAEDPTMMNWDQDGPYLFIHDSIITVQYIRGNQQEGFRVSQTTHRPGTAIPAYCYFPLDASQFAFTIQPVNNKPPHTYNDNNPILALSDIESSYKTFRDFLINSKVIDSALHWTFGKGHLVLAGDFIDRGFSATQVLWFIYKLEQEAAQQGGTVHFILGNHELKNMQGNYESSSPKYFHIAAILGKRQTELYDTTSFLGNWMASKNAIEQINGTVFVHGGLHPDIANHHLDLEKMNNIVRQNYYKPYYPQPGESVAQLLTSTKTGLCWYRGYYKDQLKQEDIERLLISLQAKNIVVGHTLQPKVNQTFGGRIIGIDVKHPKDYNKNFPFKRSEGLFIQGDKYYRVLHNGLKVAL